jgi:type I restriction enzyme, R subunit
MPYDQSLGALLHEPSFQNLLPEAVFQKARVIQKVGNQAVHSARPIRQYDALQVVRELHHLCYWLVRTYAPAARARARPGDARVPKADGAGEVVPRKELEALEKKLAEQNEEALKQQQERDALDAELQALREHWPRSAPPAEQQPDPHDYSEAETRRYLIDVELRRAGWPLDQARDREYEVTGMPNAKGIGYADYVLWGDDGKPLGVVEAKKTTADPQVGQQQAKLYADCLEKMHGQRPVIFYTNGYTTWIWDDRLPAAAGGRVLQEGRAGPPDPAPDAAPGARCGPGQGRHRRALLPEARHRQHLRAVHRGPPQGAAGDGHRHRQDPDGDRPGGRAAAGRLGEAGALPGRPGVAGEPGLQRLQGASARVQPGEPRHREGHRGAGLRLHLSHHDGPDRRDEGGEARFGVGHFDLVIIDEAHRSVYQKYGAIFRYFDSLLVGLTATPREEVDKNTYDLFDLEPGVPTDAYELEQAVADGFLVPPRVQQVDLKFPREGIDYFKLSDEEKAQWESLDWGDDVEPGTLPDRVNAAAINSWLFNRDTVDKVLQHLMEHGHKVEGGDRLAKTIIFARNHEHAKFIEERFNHHYPHHAGHFAGSSTTTRSIRRA